MKINKIFITGGAGFIGSNLTQRFLLDGFDVTIFDNLSNGRLKNINEFLGHPGFNFIEDDLNNENILNSSIENHDLVVHLASNADIAKAQVDPLIDFDEGVNLTIKVLEAMRKNNIKAMIFTSGSGVYGEVPDLPIDENFSPLLPVSTYGAQKLSSENYISAYSFMFDMSCVAFRFANVVGPKQTHGVTHDFILRLLQNNKQLEILGDGTQTKPYIHINDIYNAFKIIIEKKFFDKPFFDIFNVASEDHVTVNEIALMICKKMKFSNVKFSYTGGSRGWKADVPKYSLNSNKLRNLGWFNEYNSKQAVSETIDIMIKEIKQGLYD